MRPVFEFLSSEERAQIHDRTLHVLPLPDDGERELRRIVEGAGTQEPKRTVFLTNAAIFFSAAVTR